MTDKPLILICNDDGIRASGLLELREAVADLGDIWCVAPLTNCSGASHAISLRQALRTEQIEPQVFGVSGTPVDAVYVAMHSLLPRHPDLILSGINPGQNTGKDCLYSGTVGAACEGAIRGLAAIAFSLQHRGPQLPDFSAAKGVARRAAQNVLANVDGCRDTLKGGVLLNINIPTNLGGLQAGADEDRTIQAPLETRDPWTHSVAIRQDPRGESYYWIGGSRRDLDLSTTSDMARLEQGYVTMTYIRTVYAQSEGPMMRLLD